jgi:hypothetical protein
MVSPPSFAKAIIFLLALSPPSVSRLSITYISKILSLRKACVTPQLTSVLHAMLVGSRSAADYAIAQDAKSASAPSAAHN